MFGLSTRFIYYLSPLPSLKSQGFNVSIMADIFHRYERGSRVSCFDLFKGRQLEKRMINEVKRRTLPNVIWVVLTWLDPELDDPVRQT